MTEQPALLVPSTSSASPIAALAAMARGESLRPYEYTPPPLGPFEVEVEISHCGVCHTDIHLIDDSPAGLAAYPLVPGHEIVGELCALGSMVPARELGRRVGIGPLAGFCGVCAMCKSGRDQLCLHARYLPFGIPGGYARRVRVDWRCAFPVPDALGSADAAPLLCAGVTVFAPLLRYAAPAAHIAVVGVGGLGHLALQYARSFGCRVTAFSSSAAKRAEAMEFGAAEFVDSSDPAALAGCAATFDLLLTTASADLPWASYLTALKPRGTLCVLGLPEQDISVPAIPLLFGERRVVGSLIGSRAESQEMLAFSARHGIKPRIEVCPMHEANAALAKLRRNDVRYRMVLSN